MAVPHCLHVYALPRRVARKAVFENLNVSTLIIYIDERMILWALQVPHAQGNQPGLPESRKKMSLCSKVVSSEQISKMNVALTTMSGRCGSVAGPPFECPGRFM